MFNSLNQLVRKNKINTVKTKTEGLKILIRHFCLIFYSFKPRKRREILREKTRNAMPEILYKELSYEVQGAIFKVYKTLGCSFKESVYHNALVEELKSRKINIEKEKQIKVYYQGKKVGAYIPDIVANEQIIIELKAKSFLTKGDQKQFWDYLKGSEYKVGYLVNFGNPGGVEMVRRIYDTAREKSRPFA